MNLTKLALKRPVSVLLIILALAVFGITSITGFKLELTPDMEMPMMLVVTMYPGADPESVQELVTKEIEEAGSTLSGVTTYTSQSQENNSMVMFSYDYGMNMDDAYLDLRAALDSASAGLPDDAGDPYIIELSMNATDTMTISATANGDLDLLSYVNDTIVPELETVMGVGDVTVTGGTEDYIKVELKEDQMQQYGLTMSSISQYLAAVDFNIPAGTVEQGSQDIDLSSSASTKTITDITDTPLITKSGKLVTLGDVATITNASKPAESISRYDGNSNVSIGISKKNSYGAVNVSNEVKKVLEKLQKSNNSVELDIVYDASDTILSSLKSVGSTLVLGVVLSMLVLFIFFGDLKASLIVGSSMPVSLFVTLIMMSAMGFSLNIVTTGALVIAIGMMVDSSIVVIESCFRLKDEVEDYKEAALKGTKFITASIVASTITTVVVYFPLATMNGLSGQMFKQLGYTIIFAMLASLISALTLVPLFFMKYRPQEKKSLKINSLLQKVSNGYEKLLHKILYRKKTAVLVAVVLLALAFVMVANTNMELMPSSDEGVVAITAQFRSGTKLERIDESIQEIEKMVASTTDISDYQVSISGNNAIVTAYIDSESDVSSDDMIEYFTRELSDETNMDITVAASGESTMSMSGSGDKEIDLSGTDLDNLKIAAKQVEEEARQTPGVLHVSSDITNSATKAEITIDPLKAMSVGLTPTQVAMNINYAVSGLDAVTIKDEGKETAVTLEYPEGTYEDINSLMNMNLSTSYGTLLPLSDIASIEYTDAPDVLTRVDGVYQIAVTASTTKAAQFTASDEIDKRVDNLTFPQGVTRSVSMMEDMMQDEFAAIIKAIAIAIFLVFLVMAMQFESPKFSAMVMLSIPFSLIGSFSLLYLTRSTLSMVSLMGILMLVGIVVNNGILYVDTANTLHKTMDVERALIKSGQIRLRPILMTTLTTILSMIPLSLGIGDGGVMMQGMALVIIGGLVASTILILVLLPSFYLIIYEGNKKRKKKKEKQIAQIENIVEENK